MQFLYRGHPEIGVRLELPIKPRRSGFLRPDTQEIGTRGTNASVKIISVTIMAITVMAVAIATVARATVAGFEGQAPTHDGLFSILGLKSKLGMSGCALHRSQITT
jgi:hypothetical protein